MTRRPLCYLALTALTGLAAPTAMPATAVAAEAEAAAPQAYTLYCRGGGNQIVHVDSATKDTRLKFVATVQFKHGAANYDPSTLEPGRCTWVDRTMNGNEPYKLLFSGSHKNRSLRTSYFGKKLKLGLRDIYGKLHTPKPLEAINKLQTHGNVVELRVYSKTIDARATNGKKYEQKVLFVESVGVIHWIAPPSNKG